MSPPKNWSAPRNKLLADTVYALDSQSTLARMFGVALTTGSTVEDVLNWEKEIGKVSAEDVKAAAARVLDIRRSVTGVLLPGESATSAAQPASEPASSVN